MDSAVAGLVAEGPSYLIWFAADLDLVVGPVEGFGDLLGVFPAKVVVLVEDDFGAFGGHREGLRHIEVTLDVEEDGAVAVGLGEVVKVEARDIDIALEERCIERDARHGLATLQPQWRVFPDGD